MKRSTDAPAVATSFGTLSAVDLELADRQARIKGGTIRRSSKAVVTAQAYANELLQLVSVSDVRQIADRLKASPLTPAILMLLVGAAKQAGQSERQSRVAKSKNAKLKAKAALAWPKAHFAFRKSKIQFARDFIAQHGLTVKPETIAREWLPADFPRDPHSGAANARAYVDGKLIPKSAG